MKHKHYDMIVAKAANMGLVVLVKTCDNGAWYEKGDNNACQWWEDSDYFLCLPQHKEACLHWLNGGAVQDESDDDCGWVDCPDALFSDFSWSENSGFMDDRCKFRIKPKKEKRWIAITPDGHATDKHFKDKDDCVDYVCKDYLPSFVGVAQYIEIEVEV